MSRRIALTMRVVQTTYPSGSNEMRDAISHDWSRFLSLALPHAVWLPLPNTGQQAVQLAETLPIDGLILTGGDDVGACALRDATELALLNWAKAKCLPVLGVCRGAQMLQHFCGGVLRPVAKHHKGTRHSVVWDGRSLTVNSYHQQGIHAHELARELTPQALAEDNTVEAFSHNTLPWFGTLWHPEREATATEHDCQILKRLFGDNK